MNQAGQTDTSGYSFRTILLFAWAAAVALLHFVNLGFRDLQAWDEAAHTIRPYSIVVFGDWLDQTSHALGGLTTSAFPPLSAWLTAVAYHLFGANEWTTRLVSALCGLGTIIILGMIVRRTANTRTAVFSSLLLGTNLFFTFYTRQGQLDVPYVFFMTLAVWGWVKTAEDPSSRPGYALIAVATFGALMSKIIVGLYVPAMLLILHRIDPASRRQPKSLRRLCAALAMGCVLALPWHVYMLVQHGGAFLDAYVLFHVVGRAVTPLDAHDPSLGWLFFINQIPVRFPEAGLGAGLVLLWLTSRFVPDEQVSRLMRIASVWTVLVLVPITFSATKIVHYIVPLAIPVAALGGIALDRIASASRRQAIVLLVPLVIFAGWSALGPLRMFLKGYLLGPSPGSPAMEVQVVPLLVVLLGAVVVCILLIKRIQREKVLPVLRALPFAVLLLLSVAAVWEVAVRDRSRHDYGLRTVAELLHERKAGHVVYLGVDLNPALRLYLHWMEGWNERTKLSEYVPFAASTIVAPNPDVELPMGEKGCFVVVEGGAVERGYFLRQDSVARGFPAVFENRHYAVYQLWKEETTSGQ
jgi:4-amino-4-deoxy-L-arabinose transferase-like glycosyltransferase